MPFALFAVPGPTTPGSRKENASGERKAPTPPSDRGSWATCRAVITPPTSDVSASSEGVVSETVTVVLAAPGASERSIDVVLLISTDTPVFSCVVKPGAVALMV